MQRIGLLLLGMATLVASGVIMDRGRVGLNTMGGLGLQTVQGIRRGIGGGNSLTKDELLRQKFILDILHQVYMPLQQQDLLMLDDLSIITNENLYMRPLTQEMHMVLDLMANKQLLGKQTICDINNKQHIRQMIGFYRLLVTAGDFDTFKRLVVHARQNLNTEIFVNCLVLALGERQDTQMLIIPALYEILPQIFLKDNVIDQVLHLDTGAASVRPQLMDVMGGIGRRNMLLNSQFYGQQQQQQQGGLFDILTKSQMWMPWRELHKKIAVRKMIGGNVVQQDDTQIDKLVVSLPGNGLLSQDFDFKSYVTILIDELLVNQDTVRNLNKNQIGINGQGYESNENILLGGRKGQNNIYNSQYGNSFTGKQEGINTDRFLYAGRPLGATDELNVRHGMNIDMDVNRNLIMNEGNRFGQNIDIDNVMDRNHALPGGRYYGNVGDEIDMNRNTYTYMGQRNMQEGGQRGINTVSANDARLLFVGRRSKNPNTVLNMGYNQYYNDNDEDLISGGRRISKDERQQKNEYYTNDNDDLTLTLDGARKIYNQRYTNANKRAGIDTVNANEGRLLFSGRRSKNPNTVVNMGNNQYYENDDDLISGGRRVSKEERTYDEHQKNKYYKHDNNDDNKYAFENKYYSNDNDDFTSTLDDSRKMYNQRYTNTVNANEDRLLFSGRHSKNPNTAVNMGNNQYYENDDDLISGGRRVSKEERTYDERQKNKYYKKDNYGDSKYAFENKYYSNDNDDLSSTLDDSKKMYYQRYTNANKHAGIDTVNANEDRLLFSGRRSKNPNSAVNMGNNQFYDIEDDLISGGRRVSKEERTYDERQKNKYYKNDNYDDSKYAFDDVTKMNNERYINVNRRGMMMDINKDKEELYQNKYRSIGINDDINRSYKGLGMGIGGGRDDFLNIVTQGRMGGQRQYLNNEQDSTLNRGFAAQYYGGESLDKQLPTTNINDERLLHINRHKLNINEEERRVNNMEGVTTDDGSNLYDSGYQRGNINMQQRSRFDEETPYQQNNFDAIHRGYFGGLDIDTESNRGENYGRRQRRSIVNQEFGRKSTVNGKLVLYTLQQLVARLNLERIALGLPQLIDNSQNNIAGGLLANNLVGRSDIKGVDIQTVNKIEQIIQHIDYALQQQIGKISVESYSQKVNEIGLLLAGQIQDLGLIDILGEIFQQQQTSQQQQQRTGLIANAIENEAVQILLAGIVKVIDNKVQQIFSQREEFISTNEGITIDNVKVDGLQTYLEYTDIDLTNLLNNNKNNYGNIDETLQNNKKVVVGRVPRLNHKSFNIKIDVTSDRQQQVVVRNLLVPKVDGHNNVIPLVERRQNVIVLDVTTVQLLQGHNSLKLNSNDITLTSRDITPLTKIYQQVMQALNGDITLQQDFLAGQSTLLPHHLLLPRGTINGLPMQLITVITPFQGSFDIMKNTGLNTLLFDHLPLNYPLHCDITDLEKVIAMPNLMVKEVKIYHEDNIQMPLVHMY